MRSILRAFRTALVAHRTDLLSDAPSFFSCRAAICHFVFFLSFFSLEFSVVTSKGEGCFVLFLFILSKWKVLITAF